VAEVPFVELLPPVTPRARPVKVIADVLGPAALASDSHLGGTASGLRFRYNDAREFVWWSGTNFGAFTSAFSNAFDQGEA
jgi:hypothetical protein